MHGYDSAQPVSPLRALRGFLLALGVRRDELAADVDEAAAQFRSAVAGRQLLIILDNARRADQVRPLLPVRGTGHQPRSDVRAGGAGRSAPCASGTADLLHRVGQKIREAQAWDLRGTVQYEMGNLDTAIESHRNAAEVFRSLAARWPLAVALHNLTIALNASGNPAAHVTAAEATALLTEFNDPAATAMNESLRQFS